jgi:hypothetical protein
MARTKSLPQQLSYEHILGDFLERFDCEAVVLMCMLQGKRYFFGRWSESLGKSWVLGQCRAADPLAFVMLWEEAPAQGAPQAAAPVEAESSGQLTDEQILATFMRRVECDAALLLYLELRGGCRWFPFARWYNPDGRKWAMKLWEDKDRDNWVPLLMGSDEAPGGFGPATYAELVRSTSAEQESILAQHGISRDPEKS